MDLSYNQNLKVITMTELLAHPKISVGYRIALTEDVCRHLKVKIGDKVQIIRNDDGSILISPAKGVF